MTQKPLLDPPETALVPQTETGLVLMFERLARDPTVDVAKLKELITLQEHILAKNAEGAFWDAFASMQGELPTIDEDGQIVVGGQVRSRYSTNENLQEAIRPVLAKHGFSLSFRNRVTEKDTRVVQGILAHRSGHKEFDEFESKPDDGGSMNSIQRLGSQRSYGARYTTIALCNIVSRAKADRDDDGDQGGRPDAPDGYEAFVAVLEGLADDGLPALTKAFNDAKAPLKSYLTKHDRRSWEALKTRASKVKS